MADFAAIRDALQANLQIIDGLRAYDTAPGTIECPAAVIAPASGQFLSYGTSLGHGSDDLRFAIFVLVSAAWTRSAQDLLDSFLAGSGPMSIRAALEDTDLPGGQFAVVHGASGYGQINYAGVQYYGCQFAVTVGVV